MYGSKPEHASLGSGQKGDSGGFVYRLDIPNKIFQFNRAVEF